VILVLPDQGDRNKDGLIREVIDVTGYLYVLTRVDRDNDGLIREVKEL
jgi:hypothetical protein